MYNWKSMRNSKIEAATQGFRGAHFTPHCAEHTLFRGLVCQDQDKSKNIERAPEDALVYMFVDREKLVY